MKKILIVPIIILLVVSVAVAGILPPTSFDGSIYSLLLGRSGGQTIIGGTGVTDVLKLQGTSGNGTLTSPAIQMLTGNNGATTALTVLNDGKVGIGTDAPTQKLQLELGTFLFTATGTSYVNISLPGASESSRRGAITLSSFAGGDKVYLTAAGDSYLNGGNVGINEASPGAKLQINAGASTTIGQIIKLAATPTADAFNINTNGGSGGDIFKVTAGGLVANGPQAVTCTDSGDGNPGALTITPSSSIVKLSNNDANGCTITMGETGMVDGTRVEIWNISANSATIADSNGVQEVTGAGTITIAEWRRAVLLYSTDRWIVDQ